MPGANELVVVIVDDNEMDRYLAKRHLSTREEFSEIIEAGTGSEFLDFISNAHQLKERPKQPILVLMDINMPMMDGFETAQALQQRVEAGEVPSTLVVMMFTSSDNPEDRQRAEEIGIIKGYIVKPIDDQNIQSLTKLFRTDPD